MEFRLVQRDHPNAWVNDAGLTPRDPYFRACWGPLLDDWTTHFVARVSELTQARDRMVPFDDLARELGLDRAIPQVRIDTISRVAVQAENAGMGWRIWQGPERQGFGVYRNIPLLNEHGMRHLTDPELFAHADTVNDVNGRLAAAGREPVELPDWLATRLGRGDPSARLPTRNATESATRRRPMQPRVRAGPAASGSAGRVHRAARCPIDHVECATMGAAATTRGESGCEFDVRRVERLCGL